MDAHLLAVSLRYFRRLAVAFAAGTVLVNIPLAQAQTVDLIVVKSAPSTSLNGQELVYDLRLTNSGPSDADGATFKDPVPAGMTVVSATCDSTSALNGAACPASISIVGQTVSGTLGAFPNGGQVDIQITARAPLRGNSSYSNTATLTPPAGRTETNPGTNTSTANTAITYRDADLAATVVSAPASFALGDSLTYVLDYENLGPGPADGAIVRFQAHSNFEVSGGVTGIQLADRVVTCEAFGGAQCPTMPALLASQQIGNSAVNLFNLNVAGPWPAGGRLRLSVTFIVADYAGPASGCGATERRRSLRTTAAAAINTGLTDPVAANNTDTTDTSGELVPQAPCPQVDLRTVKNQNMTAWAFDTPIEYTVVHTNHGLGPADGSTISDWSMGSGSLGSASSINFDSAEVVSCVATAGTTCPVTFSVSPAGTVTNGSYGVRYSGVVPTWPVDGEITVVYRMTPRSYNRPACGPAAFSRLNISNQGRSNVPVGIVDPNAANNLSTVVATGVEDPLPNCPEADLQSTMAPADAPLLFGQPFTFTSTHRNNGPDAADGASVTGNRVMFNHAGGVTGITFIDATLTCTASGGATCPETLTTPATGTMTTGSVNYYGNTVIQWPAGGELTYTYTFVPTGYIGNCAGDNAWARIRGTASNGVGSSGVTDPVATNNSMPVSSDYGPRCVDVSINKMVDPPVLVPDGPVTFMIDVSLPPAAGTVTNLYLEDILPAGFIYDHVATTCSVLAGIATCVPADWDPVTRTFSAIISEIQPGATIRYALHGVAIDYSSTWFNTATVTHNPGFWDPAPVTNSSTVNVGIQGADPRVTKQSFAETKSIRPGDPVRYRLTLSNPVDGSPISDMVFSDVLQNGFTYLSTDSVDFSGGAVRATVLDPTVGASNLQWGSFSVPAGGSVTISFTAATPGTLSCGPLPLQNSVTVDYQLLGVPMSRAYDGELIGNDADDVFVPCPATLTKSLSPTTINSRQAAILTFTLTPPADSAPMVLPITFTDMLPAGWEVQSTVVSPNTCAATVTNDLGGPLTAGATGVRVANAHLRENGTLSCTVAIRVTNRLAVFNPSCDANPAAFTNGAGNISDLDNVINGVQDVCLVVNQLPVAMTKAFSPSTILEGENSTVTITLTNPAGHAATTVSFTDTLPAGLAVVLPATLGGTCANIASQASLAGNVLTVTDLPIGDNTAGAGSLNCTITLAVTHAPNRGNPTCSGNPTDFTNGSANVTNRSANLAYTASPCLVVASTPKLDKVLSPRVILNGQSAQLTFTITNGLGSPAQTGVGFIDTLPTNWRVADDVVSNTCAGAITNQSNAPLEAGHTSVRLTGGELADGQASCQITVNVTNAPGQFNTNCASNPVAWTNRVGTNQNISGLANLANRIVAPQCMVVLNAEMTVEKNFQQLGLNISQVEVGTATVDTVLTVRNPSNVPMTGFELVDVLPQAGDVAADGSPRGSTATGALTGAIAGLPAGVTVQYSTQSNPCRSTVSDGQNVGGGLPDLPPGCTAPDWQVTVANYSTVRAVKFVGSGLSVTTGGQVVLQFPLSISPAAVAEDWLVNDVAATYTVAAGGGLPVGASDLAQITLAAASLSGTVFDDLNSDGVQDPGEVGLAGFLVVAQCQAGPTCVPGTAYSMVTDASGEYAFTAGAAGIFDSADGSGTALASFPGLLSGTWSLTEVPPAGAPYINVSTTPGTVNSTASGTGSPRQINGIVLPVGATGEDYLFGEILATGPVVSKAFEPSTVHLGGGSRLTLTLTNANSVVATLAAVLTDNLPAGVVVAPVPDASTTCAAGSVAAIAGASVVELGAGAQIPAAIAGTPGACTVAVDVIGTAAGVHTNEIAVGALQTGLGNSAVAATADLTVLAPATLTVTKTITPADVAVTGSFPFAVSCQTPTATYNGSVTVAAGNTGAATVSVPAGSSVCTVAEEAAGIPAAPGGYAWAAPQYAQPDAGAVVAGGTLSATITNPLRALTGGLNIAVDFTGGPVGYAPTDAVDVFAICDLPTAGTRYPAVGYVQASVATPGVISDVPVDATCEVFQEASSLPDAPENYRWGDGSIAQPIGQMTPGGTLDATITNPLLPLDPPFIRKTGRTTGFGQVEWTIVLINNHADNAGQAPVRFSLADSLPAGMDVVAGSVACTPFGAGQTTVTACDFDMVNNEIVTEGMLAYTSSTDAASAPERVEVLFQATVGAGEVRNTATVSLPTVLNSDRSSTASVRVTVEVLPVPLWDSRTLLLMQLALFGMLFAVWRYRLRNRR